MNQIISLINQLRDQNIKLSLTSGNNLRVESAEGTMTDEILSLIKDNKTELITFIGNHRRQFSRIERVPEADAYPLSSSQHSMWLSHSLDETGVANVISRAIKITGTVQLDVLEAAISLLIQRHEILRTVFRETAGKINEIYQYICLPEEQAFRITYKNLPSKQALSAEIQQITEHKFSLSEGPLWRIDLLQTNVDQYILVLHMHHIISDGWSIARLMGEVFHDYNAILTGADPLTTELALQYRDYAHWQKRTLASGAMDDHRNYWLEQLKGQLPVLELTTDFPRPPLKTYRGAQIHKTIGKEVLEPFQKSCLAHNATLFTGLLTTINVLMYRYTNQEDVVIGSVVAGRAHPDLENQIGFYVNTLALRTTFAGDASYTQLLALIKENVETALQHQSYPFEEVVSETAQKRDISRHPLFDVLLILQADTHLTRDAIIGADIEEYPLQSAASQFDITFEFREHLHELTLEITYNSELYEAWRINAMAQHIEHLLCSLCQYPDQPIKRLSYLPAAEERRLLEDFSGGQQNLEESATYLDLFDEQCRKNPENTAFSFEEKHFSYRELQAITNRFAHFLRDNFDLQPDDRVAIQLPRTEWLYFSILGVLKAGGAYVPIDPKYPAERKAYIIDDCQAKVVIDEHLINSYLMSQEVYENKDLPTTIKATNLAYVIYTSGSTGKPKGVMIEHRNLVAFTKTITLNFGIRPPYVMAATTNFVFDISVLEILGTLANGIPSILLSGETAEVLQYIAEGKVDIFQCTPSKMLEIAEEVGPTLAGLKRLRVLLVGGEAFSQSLYRLLIDQLPDTATINGYGPTEGTIYSTALLLPKSPVLSIGKPLVNQQIYILDQENNLCPIGNKGEMCIAGDRLARGYLNRESLTREKFVANPFVPGTRMYRTGDFGRWLPDGNIEFLGRMDEQVKIRGYRIELGEVENALLELENTRAAAVVAIENQLGVKELVAYLVGKRKLEVSELRQQVAKALPEYMLPAYFVELKEMPVNSNGKLDKKALPTFGEDMMVRAVSQPPTTVLEKQLAELWAEVLSVKKVGVSDNFFELGGDSLKASILAAKVGKQLAVTANNRTVFTHPTILGFAQWLEQQRSIRADQDAWVAAEVPLTPFQQQVYGQKALFGAHRAILISAPDGFDLQPLKQALQQLLDRHEVLSGTFKAENPHSWQCTFQRELNNSFSVVDLKAVQAPAQRMHALATEVCTQIDWQKEPFLKSVLFNLPEGDHLLMVFHPVMIDEVSWSIILQDLAVRYKKMFQGNSNRLPENTTDYREWLALVQRHSSSEKLRMDRKYWSTFFQHPTATIPTKPNFLPTARLANGKQAMAISLDEGYTKKLLTEANAAYHTLPKDLLLAALTRATAKFFSSEQIALIQTCHERVCFSEELDLSKTVGQFKFIYPVRLVAVVGDDLSKQIKLTKEYLRKIPKQGFGYGFLSSEFTSNNLPQLHFEYTKVNSHLAQVVLPTDLHWRISSLFDSAPVKTRCDDALKIMVDQQNGHLTITFGYPQHLFDPATIHRWLAAYKDCLEQMIDHCCDQSLVELTPSDFDYKNLSLDDLEELESLLG